MRSFLILITASLLVSCATTQDTQTLAPAEQEVRTPKSCDDVKSREEMRAYYGHAAAKIGAFRAKYRAEAARLSLARRNEPSEADYASLAEAVDAYEEHFRELRRIHLRFAMKAQPGEPLKPKHKELIECRSDRMKAKQRIVWIRNNLKMAQIASTAFGGMQEEDHELVEVPHKSRHPKRIFEPRPVAPPEEGVPPPVELPPEVQHHLIHPAKRSKKTKPDSKVQTKQRDMQPRSDVEDPPKKTRKRRPKKKKKPKPEKEEREREREVPKRPSKDDQKLMVMGCHEVDAPPKLDQNRAAHLHNLQIDEAKLVATKKRVEKKIAKIFSNAERSAAWEAFPRMQKKLREFGEIRAQFEGDLFLVNMDASETELTRTCVAMENAAEKAYWVGKAIRNDAKRIMRMRGA